MPFASSVHELRNLVLSFHPAVVIDSGEEERVERLLDTVAAELGMPVFEWTISRGLARRPDGAVNRTLADPALLLAHLEAMTVEALFVLKDLAPHLAEPTAARRFQDAARRFAHTRSTLFLVGPTSQLPPALERRLVRFALALPGQGELAEALDHVAESLQARGRADVELDEEGRRAVLRALAGLTLNQARQVIAQALIEDGKLSADDVPRILDDKARMLGDDALLEYLPARDNVFELGGFARLDAWLARARVGFTPEAAALNLAPPRGLLLVGVQGCGKSLAAKCIARRWQLPLLKLDAGRLYDKYIGETERNLRRALEVAESMAPCVLWIDELEKAFASASSERDGGVSQRVFATFLTWMQEKKKEVFLVATANNVFGLPPELLRKGRFDEIFFVDLPDAAAREVIFRIHLSERKQDPALFELDQLAAATEGFSGAEIEQVVTGALYGALHRRTLLDSAALVEEAGQTVPLSVTRREDIDRLRALASERFVPVA